MSPMALEDLERHLERLPREAWDRPAPPPPPWPVEVAPPVRWRRGLFLRPLAAAAASLALVAAGIAAGVVLSGHDDAPRGAAAAPVRVELGPVGGRGRGATGVVRLEPRSGGRATVALAGLRPSDAGDFYELWLLGEDGELVSLGSLRVPQSGRATLQVQLPVDPARFRYLDVSREPADGDPSHSTISILRGPAT